MSDQPVRYWFRPKRYGWGWGIPATWEGWTVLLGYFAVAFLPLIALPDRIARRVSLTTTLGGAVVLVCIAYRKGPPPRWRWGNRRRPS